jgi:hypothetical protein
MVEFPLVARQGARVCGAGKEIYLRYRHLLTLILCHQTGLWPDWYVGN